MNTNPFTTTRPRFALALDALCVAGFAAGVGAIVGFGSCAGVMLFGMIFL